LYKNVLSYKSHPYSYKLIFYIQKGNSLRDTYEVHLRRYFWSILTFWLCHDIDTKFDLFFVFITVWITVSLLQILLLKVRLLVAVAGYVFSPPFTSRLSLYKYGESQNKYYTFIIGNCFETTLIIKKCVTFILLVPFDACKRVLSHAVTIRNELTNCELSITNHGTVLSNVLKTLFNKVSNLIQYLMQCPRHVLQKDPS